MARGDRRAGQQAGRLLRRLDQRPCRSAGEHHGGPQPRRARALPAMRPRRGLCQARRHRSAGRYGSWPTAGPMAAAAASAVAPRHGVAPGRRPPLSLDFRPGPPPGRHGSTAFSLEAARPELDAKPAESRIRPSVRTRENALFAAMRPAPKAGRCLLSWSPPARSARSACRRHRRHPAPSSIASPRAASTTSCPGASATSQASPNGGTHERRRRCWAWARRNAGGGSRPLLRQDRRPARSPLALPVLS
jgi:hypothetical protein